MAEFDPNLFDPSLLTMAPPPPSAASGAPAGLPPEGVPVAQYMPPPAPAPARPQVDMLPATTAALPAPQAQPPSMGAPAVPAKSVTDRESTTSTTRTTVGPQERAAQAKLDDDQRKSEELARQKGDLAAREADARTEAAERNRQIAEQHGPQLKEIATWAENEWAQRNQRYEDKLTQATSERPKDFWGYDDNGKPRTDTGSRRFWAGIAMALGAFGASENGGRNVGVDMISGAIERRDRSERERIERLYKDADRLRADRDEVWQRKQEKLADLSANKAAQYDVAAKRLEAGLAQMGRPKAEIETNADVLKLRQERDQAKAQWAQVERQEIRNQVVTKTQKIVGGAGAGTGTKVSGDDIQQIARLDADIKNIDDLAKTIGKSPVAWVDYKANMERWQRRQAMQGGVLGTARGAMQALGMMDVAPEQGLKTGAGKRVHMGMEAVKNSIAKGYGGVITEGDRQAAASELATLGATSTEQRATLKRIRDNLEMKRQLYLQNKAVTVPTQPQAQPPTQERTAPQSGGGDVKRVRNKRTGEEMVVRVGPDGRYYPVEQMAAR